MKKINHRSFYDDNYNVWSIKWKDHFDHIYCIHSNKDHSRSDLELKRVGIIDSGIFSYFSYDISFDAKSVRNFKAKTAVDAIKDAYEKGYERIMVLMDDVKFIHEDVAVKIIKKTINGDIVLLNNGDISCDCVVFSRKAIEKIYSQKINYANAVWKTDLRKSLSVDKDIVGMATSIPFCVHPIDYVITYVDGNEPEWKAEHEKYGIEGKGNGNAVNRFRSWDNIQYILRGIDENMTFIDRVFLVVSSEKQVPKCINTNRVNVVLHKDIIPQRHLPTFNSCTIEMFLGTIIGMSEYFIYGNDDVFPVGKIHYDQNYTDGMPMMTFKRLHVAQNNAFHMQCLNSCKMAAKDVGVKYVIPIRQYHGNSPLTRTSFEHILSTNGDEIDKRCTMFRDRKNLNQYLFMLFNYYYYGIPQSPITLHYFQCERDNKAASKDICGGVAQYVCINDNTTSDGDMFENLKKNINMAFEKRFPNKSKYEI